ncbi:MAG TPA: hypothetical protein VH583_07965 [Vicinamibacterales bacterium]|jgi:hypothetical protein
MTSVERGSPAFWIVTRLFLRRLIDNELISPHADRHESFAVLYGFVVTIGVFATFFLCTGYLAAFVQLPGPAALSALSDRFLYIAASMTLSALAALMVWDALALEPRDAAILGPLPIAANMMTRAKLAAAVLFGATLTVGLNAVPSVLYPLFLTLNIRGTTGATILRLIAVHAMTVTMSGLFGFFGVLAVRGMARLTIGERAFRRLGSIVQTLLIVAIVTGLLLAPTVRAATVREWVASGTAPHWPTRPVLWYLGLNETLAGHEVAETPVVMPPRMRRVPSQTLRDQTARATYRLLLPRFSELAHRAWTSLLLIVGIAVALFLWTNRRLPNRSAGVSAPRVRATVRRLAERAMRDDPEAQAGFFFSLQTLTRSAPHRTIIAAALAVGLTHAFIALTTTGVHRFASGSTPLGVFAVSILMLGSLLIGFSYAVTVPAELVANWTIRSAWHGDERRYLAGVKSAAVLGLIALPLAVLLPLNVVLLGVGASVMHSALAFMVAVAALDLLFLSYRKVPFVCSYIPVENPKLLWPAGIAALLLGTYASAAAERWALETAVHAVLAIGALAVIVIVLKAFDRERRLEPVPIDFDARPSLPTQRLGLFDRIVTQD